MWRYIFWLLLFLLGGLGGIWVKRILQDPVRFPIAYIQVYGSYRNIDQADIQQRIMPYVQQSFYAISLRRLQKALMHFPGVKSVSIVRKWPDTLTITMEPELPLAIWNDKQLITSDGVIYDQMKDHGTGLPQLIGKAKDAEQVLAAYRQDAAILQAAQATLARLESLGGGVWKMTLADGVQVMLGGDNQLQQLQRFAAVYPSLNAGSSGEALAFIDLRYRNGMAVSRSKTDTAA